MKWTTVSGLGLIKILIRRLPGPNMENQEKAQSGQLIIWQIFRGDFANTYVEHYRNTKLLG
jgi:hypothetical protein